MAEKKERPALPHRGGQQISLVAERVSWLIVAVTTIVLPLVVSFAGKDAFRLPKQLMLEASGIVLAAIAICAMLIADPLGREKRWPRSLLFVIGAALLWSGVTTLVSTNRILSIFSLVIVAAATMFFVAAYNAVQNRSIAVLYVALAPALINALLTIAQRTAIWTPFTNGEQPDRMRAIGFLGNPDDVGMFLVAPTLAAAALATASKKHRVPAGIIGVILIAGLLASETLGAILALCAGMVVLLVVVRPRVAAVAGLVALLLTMGVVSLSPARWATSHVKLTAVGVDRLLSGRTIAFFAAWRMFRQHPISGVGLGCFAFHYFDEKIAVEMDHPWLMNRHTVNYGEAHNEHLQILAEGGLPAYAIFIAALAVLALPSFRRLDCADSTPVAFSHHLALPLAAAITVLALSSFPFRLAAPTANALFICAITLAWDKDANA